ncbi:MAG: hypothetical protein Terrestrivirus8_4 [Terrestrivirus sp.]|uniref:Uncharacterized protein n=1 Tax=Terrestrivirus sp. TaxID=2487775 RepID=A0A3G4ZR94_9VIRU|nr:MAG: hypothetical protein Terrestrivirus8_4 [Terrestrivirus sp.]
MGFKWELFNENENVNENINEDDDESIGEVNDAEKMQTFMSEEFDVNMSDESIELIFNRLHQNPYLALILADIDFDERSNIIESVNKALQLFTNCIEHDIVKLDELKDCGQCDSFDKNDTFITDCAGMEMIKTLTTRIIVDTFDRNITRNIGWNFMYMGIETDKKIESHRLCYNDKIECYFAFGIEYISHDV